MRDEELLVHSRRRYRVHGIEASALDALDLLRGLDNRNRLLPAGCLECIVIGKFGGGFTCTGARCGLGS